MVAPASGLSQVEWETVENGWSTAYVLSGSYTATVAAHGDMPAFTQTVSAGQFNHDDRPEWPAGVMVRFAAEAGTRWRCFHQPWLRPSAATQRIFDAPHHIVMPPSSILVVVEEEYHFRRWHFRHAKR